MATMNGFTFKIMLRSFVRNKLFSVINIVGLAAGLAVSLLIFMLVYNELSYDRSFPDYKQIYRVNTVWQDHRAGEKTGMTPIGLAQVIEESVPGVETVVRIWNRGHIVKTDTYERDMRAMYVEENFFNLFPTPILYGSFEEALSRPDGVALSETQAKAMFGEGDPTGKTFLYGPWLWEVRAVFRDFPKNTSVGYPIFTGFLTNTMYQDPRAEMIVDVDTYLLLNDQADVQQVSDRLEEIAADRYKDQEYTFELMPLTDFHLHSENISAHRIGNSKGDLGQVRMFSILAVVILLIVCINYMNLSTAQAQKRLREISLNKILGAQRSSIVFRSYLESAMLTLLAFLLAFGLFFLLLPGFSNLVGVSLSYGMVWNWGFLLGITGIFLFTVLFSASYSAFYLSNFPTVMGSKPGGSGNKVIRETLSVAQFAVAIVLITWVLLIDAQTRYIYAKDLGYNPEQLIGLWIRTAGGQDGPGYEGFENELRQQSSVLEISRVSNFPGASEGALRTSPSEEGFPIKHWVTDEHIVDMLQLKLISGRSLPAPYVMGDSILYMMLNRRATAHLESTPEEIIGRRLYLDNIPVPFVVCGVVEDFNFQSLYSPITPAAFLNMPSGRFYLIARVADPGNAANMAIYKEIFERHYPTDMFDVHYIKEEIDASYGGIKKTESLLVLFTFLAILMACMGVFALTNYLVEQRTKEIGIRRVLGSTVGGILGLFARTYLKLLGIALVIAIPASILIANNYLSTFAFHVNFSWWMIAAAAGITLVLVLIAVIAPTFKAANTDPVKNIKYE